MSTLVATEDEFARLRDDAERALLAWLREDQHPMLSDDGHAMVWSNGRPVALDVALALRALDGVRVVVDR